MAVSPKESRVYEIRNLRIHFVLATEYYSLKNMRSRINLAFVLLVITSCFFPGFVTITMELAIKRRIMESFVPTNFVPPHGPLSFITCNPHYQTIVGSEILKYRTLKIAREFETICERFTTSEGDFFDVEYTEGFNTNEKVVLLLHGLESNVKGPHITRMAQACLGYGFDCCLVSFRSCNGEDNNTPGAYHMGFTDDLHQLVQEIHRRYPSKQKYFSGFSLGGNVLLKFLGELGSAARDFNVRGGVAACVPFTLRESQRKVDQGISRTIYSENFLKTLKLKAEEKHRRFPNSFDIEAIRRCKTIGDFDDAFVAVIYGYKDRVDYYEKTDSKKFLNLITVPSLVINALDDPFVDANYLPTSADLGEAPVRLVYTEKGGHCGYKAHSCASPNGWLAEELARALNYIHNESDAVINSDVDSTSVSVVRAYPVD